MDDLHERKNSNTYQHHFVGLYAVFLPKVHTAFGACEPIGLLFSLSPAGLQPKALAVKCG